MQSTPASVEPVDFGGSVGGGDNGRSVMDTSVEWVTLTRLRRTRRHLTALRHRRQKHIASKVLGRSRPSSAAAAAAWQERGGVGSAKSRCRLSLDSLTSLHCYIQTYTSPTPTRNRQCHTHVTQDRVQRCRTTTQPLTGNLAIANRSRVSCAHKVITLSRSPKWLSKVTQVK